MNFPRLMVCLTCIALLVSCADSRHSHRTAKNIDPASRPESTKKVATSLSANPYFIQVSDVHLDSKATTTNYGHDTGTELWTKTIVKLTEIIRQKPAPKFIIYTGDLPAHYDCGTTCFIPPDQRKTHHKNIAQVLTDLRKLAEDTGIPLLFTPGNNDSLAGDYCSYADENNKTPLSLAPDSENAYPALNSMRTCGNAPCIVSNPHPQMGYYSARPIEGLRVITLNSIILGQRYHQVDGVEQVDAGNTQMSWLSTELVAARLSGEKVLIIMHIPPGKNAYAVAHNRTPTQMWAQLPLPNNNWMHQFLTLVKQYQSEITGILYGHTHMDEVRRLYDVDGVNITEVAVSAPGVSPQHNNNPGFKIYWYSYSTKELLDFETYYTTPAALSWGKQSYHFSTIFGCDANSTLYQCLSDASLADVNAAMDTIFTVMHGAPAYKTKGGIEVKAE
ncbi:metallophosphoesterase [Desulfogranum marinum]|uniref:metallophosphoesterase n=1 Tax=Desulfogranum marinum TaxID=453220 RepID=UPI0029C84683|nr:metallophosphoesterase [Desulfogranum marinum]